MVCRAARDAVETAIPEAVVTLLAAKATATAGLAAPGMRVRHGMTEHGLDRLLAQVTDHRLGQRTCLLQGTACCERHQGAPYHELPHFCLQYASATPA